MVYTMREAIRVGDMVKVRILELPNYGKLGLVTDQIEDNDGFMSFEVVFPDDRGWYGDLELVKVKNED